MKHPNILAMASAASSALVVGAADAMALPKALRATAGFGAPLVTAEMTPQALMEQINGAITAMRTDIDNNVGSRVDGLVTARIETINTAISNMTDAMQALQAQVDAGVGAVENVIGDIPGDPAYVGVFNQFMRRGEDADSEVRAALNTRVQAAMQMGTGADGGYLAPIEWDRSITQQLLTAPSIRPYADNITITGPGFKRLVAVGRPGSGWVGETAARPQTSTPTFAEVTFGIGEIYANPAITQTALDDAAINLEQWLAGEVRDEFSRQEGVAFLAGDGVNKPKGLLTFVTGGTRATEHPLGDIKADPITADATSTAFTDALLDTIYRTPAERIAGAQWYMNRTTQASIRKIKDADGNYLWQPGLTAGQPGTIHGYGIIDLPGMPVYADGNGSIIALFGNMRATYLVIDRIGIRVLRDPYTNKPYVMFYTTKRVGGGVQNPEYMRAVKRNAA